MMLTRQLSPIAEQIAADEYWPEPLFDPCAGLGMIACHNYRGGILAAYKETDKMREIASITLALPSGVRFEPVEQGVPIPAAGAQSRKVIRIVCDARGYLSKNDELYRRFEKRRELEIPAEEKDPRFKFDAKASLMLDPQQLYIGNDALELVDINRRKAMWVQRQVCYARSAADIRQLVAVDSQDLDNERYLQEGTPRVLPNAPIGEGFEFYRRTLKYVYADILEATGIVFNTPPGKPPKRPHRIGRLGLLPRLNSLQVS